jgi:hypothetical protein
MQKFSASIRKENRFLMEDNADIYDDFKIVKSSPINHIKKNTKFNWSNL